jgi:signal transduction histidine kinase/CheY-like chemotaxis protein
VVFGHLLDGLLELMDSEYGFIGEIKYDNEGIMFLQTHAITNIAWNASTQAFYEENVESGLKFTNLDSLFGKVLTTKEPVISANPATDPRACGLPEGHPPLNYFLGIPFFEQGGDYMNGMVGIANKPGGYTQADIEFLEPLVVTCSNLIQGFGAVQRNKYLINSLEEKVAERTNALQMANVDLEEANHKVMEASAAQLQHFACMSHEIRTPLNGIIGLSSLLLDTKLTAAQEDSLRMIATSGDLLLTVVNDVLDFAKLQSGNVNIDIRQTNLQETLDAVVHAIENIARERNVTVKTIYDATVPGLLETDGRRLQQILYNLLGNAIKFSKDGGLVELRIELDSASCEDNVVQDETIMVNNDLLVQKEDLASRCPFDLVENESSSSPGGNDTASGCPFHLEAITTTKTARKPRYLRFVVKDYGKGIAEKHFDKIFQPFKQASGDTEREFGGTGLGLAITSKLVTGLGGTVAVASEVGEWSEFTAEFPFEASDVDIDALSTQLKKAHVILINDDEKEAGITDVLQRYKTDFSNSESMDVLEAMVEKEGSFDPHAVYVCLIHEDLYRPETYKRLTNIANTALVTFGPNYRVHETDSHHRSLVQMLQCVLMQSIASHVVASNKAGLLDTRMQHNALPAPLNQGGLKNVRVLIAEDNLINQKVLSRSLQRLGLEDIAIVDNGQKAVDQCFETQYDLVFMDMQMPVMGGVEACRLITARREPNGLPKVIFVTANASEAFEQEGKDAGGDGFISKPFNLSKLEHFLHSWGYVSCPCCTFEECIT